MSFQKTGKPGPKPPKPLQRRTPLRPVREGKKPKRRGGRSTGKATEAQIARWDQMREIGCVCCLQLRVRSYGALEIHHLNLGGNAGQKRLGHDQTVCLCPWHHRGVVPNGRTVDYMELKFDASLARASKQFRRTFGLDSQLLEYQNKLLEPCA